jgi:hypothetical protein
MLSTMESAGLNLSGAPGEGPYRGAEIPDYFLRVSYLYLVAYTMKGVKAVKPG